MTEAFTGEVPNPKFSLLSDYESWVSENWVHQLGSDDAQLHVRAKLNEEVSELAEALDTQTPDEVKSELGDVLWTASAVAINEGFRLEQAVRHSTLGYYFPDGHITFESIDKLATSGEPIEWDVPVLRALYGLNNDDIERAVGDKDHETTSMVLNSLAHQLGKSARITRALDPLVDKSADTPPTFGDAWHSLQEARVVESLAQLTVLVSKIAQAQTGSSLAEVAQANYDKLSDRLSRGEPVTK